MSEHVDENLFHIGLIMFLLLFSNWLHVYIMHYVIRINKYLHNQIEIFKIE